VRNNLWLFIVLAAAVLLVALVVYFVPVIRGGWRRFAPSRGPSAFSSSSPSPSPLVQGFGYLYATPRFTRYRRRVEDRLDRAFQRIAAVDPDAAPRRIGLAMLQSGLVDPPTRSAPAADQGAPWGNAPSHDDPGDTR
jgi:hypothetical protein